MTHPILYSFRRCPYAMRARLALVSAGVTVQLREVVLRDKPAAFLETSPSGTVPCLKLDERVIDESFDIMIWALQINDPEGMQDLPDTGAVLITDCDSWFKTALDRYKYATRHQDVDIAAERSKAAQFVAQLDSFLKGQPWLFGKCPSMADLAVLPFVRQFAHVDPEWFWDQPWRDAIRWLEAFKSSSRFLNIMQKYPQWKPGDQVTLFP